VAADGESPPHPDVVTVIAVASKSHFSQLHNKCRIAICVLSISPDLPTGHHHLIPGKSFSIIGENIKKLSAGQHRRTVIQITQLDSSAEIPGNIDPWRTRAPDQPVKPGVVD
jgi:hypothetical protein